MIPCAEPGAGQEQLELLGEDGTGLMQIDSLTGREVQEKTRTLKNQRVRHAAAPGLGTGFMVATKEDFRRDPEKYAVAALSVINAIVDPPSSVRSGTRALGPLLVALEEAIRNTGH